MTDPFRITGPAVVSFSGGRTSAYMLHRILRAHGGTLPADVVVCFANTGREFPQTLDFVQRCATEWSVPVVWLEFRHAPGRYGFEIVSHNSASRAGEPFDALMAAHSSVPDPFRRFCTEQLKVATLKRYLVSLGWKQWANVVGLRADETARVERRRKKEANPKHRDPWRSVFPLFDAGADLLDVRKFWRAQSFDLLVPPGGGNCDACFMKSSATLGELFRAYPERMAWWPESERKYGAGKTMVLDRGFAEIARVAESQGVLPWDDAQPCEEGCGI